MRLHTHSGTYRRRCAHTRLTTPPNQLPPRGILGLLGRQGSRPAGGLWHVAIVADDDSGVTIAEELYTREFGIVTCAATRIGKYLLGSHIEQTLTEFGSRVWG